jgi:DNA-binding IscR family transcriptional regulator
MLNQLLELLRAGGTRRVADLARELDTTSELVEVMLEDLCRMGYLKQVGGKCGGKCAACPMAGMCAAGSQGQLWAFVTADSEEVE